jgi:hypothetical protein
VVYNARVYTVDDGFSMATAFAIRDGRFIGVGSDAGIRSKYKAEKTLDAGGKTIVPGLIDAHCHFYALGLKQQQVDLTGTQSFGEVLTRVKRFQDARSLNFIFGTGWDQNDWEQKAFPDKTALDSLFPDIPVVLERIDGHAMLVNQKAMDLAGITPSTPAEGGEIVLQDGKLSGILIDNPMQYIYEIVPPPGRDEEIEALLAAEKICVANGLTTVDDAGLSPEIIALVDSLQQSGALAIRMYAMVSATPENLDYFLASGPVKTDRLNVRSFKVYADGALGSRGAALKAPYTDKPGHYGAMVTTPARIREIAARIAASDFQMNTHAIGDSANAVILRTYRDVLENKPDRRWKVEHAQVVSPEEATYFEGGIIPSVQPTHATSDMYWAEDRLGAKRVHNAYAYKTLLNAAGMLALGTDFPVEEVSPFYTFYAAVARQDLKGYPAEGYMAEEALSREDALRGMTLWAAYSNFEESERGSIEPNKWADFVILSQDIMQVPAGQIPKTLAEETFIAGKPQLQ